MGGASSPSFSPSAGETYARQPGSATVLPLDLNWCPAHSSVTVVSRVAAGVAHGADEAQGDQVQHRQLPGRAGRRGRRTPAFSWG